MKSLTKTILLNLVLGMGYGRQVLRGIQQEIRSLALPWVLQLDNPYGISSGPLSADLDGAMISLPEPKRMQQLRDSGIPAIIMTGHPLGDDMSVSRVSNDQVSLGSIAAETLMDLGYRRFAYIKGWGNVSDSRSRAFTERLAMAGYKVFSKGVKNESEAFDCIIDHWSQNPEQPLAVFATWDVIALRMVSACRMRGIAVPEQIAILGCDNDNLLCEICEPPLSSIAVDGLRIGREGVRLMKRMLEGDAVLVEEHLFPPLGVVFRQSTRSTAQDALVARTLVYFEEHYNRQLQLPEVARELGVSVRTLAYRFKQSGAGTAQHALIRTRIRRAQQALLNSDCSASDIAATTGFTSAQYFFQTFRKYTGMTPSEYRGLLKS